jgi:signal transduction histidine kinase
MSRLCRFALACWLLCCLAFAGVAARANDFVDFAKVGSYLDLTFRLEILEDSAAALTSEQVLLQPSWQPARPQNLNRGVTNAAVWLKFQVENRSGKSLERWLTLGSPRLEQVDYYRLRSGNAQPVETAVSGLAHPLALRPEAGLVSIFPVKLDPGESATLLLRVAGRTRMLLEPGLWEPLAYRAQESDLTVRQLVPLCALLGVALCMLVHSLVRRDRSLLLLATWLSVLALFEFSFRGHLYRAVFYEGGEPAVRATVVLTNLVMLLCASFTLLFLRLYQQRGWRLAYLLFVLANLLLILQAAFADLRAANVLTVPLLVLFFVIWPISILAAWHRGVANAGLFSLASFGLCLAIVLRLVEQMGWLTNDLIPGDNVTTQPSLVLVLALVMGYGLVRSSFVEQKAYRAAQAALLKSRQDEHVRLEALVRERTQTLQNAVIVADEAHRARAELLARVNHDLRRPAAEIVDLVAPFLQATGKQQEYGTVIRRSATHLQGLIDDLIVEAGAGSPLGGIKPEPVEILGLLDGLAAEAEGLARAGGNEFDFSPGPGLPPLLLVDAKRLRQVLINLLDNAAKFTQGGRVEFKVDVNQGPVPVTLIFSVRDTGPGMSASQLAMVFEPYRRADESAGFPGLGLGLAIARYWVERMGGEIVADSVPGQGTTMRVLLPVSLPAVCAASESTAREMSVPGLPDLAVPAPELLAEASALLRLGAVSDLEDWAAGLQDSQPQHGVFARSVAELVERGDLRGLAVLLDRAASAGPVGAAGADRTAGRKVTP